MSGIIKDLLRKPFFYHFPRIHHCHIIRHLCHNAQIMGDVDDRNPCFLLNIFNQLQDFSLNGYVQSCSWFITNQYLRITGQSNCNYHSLPHSSGKLMGIAFHSLFRLCDSNQIKKFHRFFIRFFFTGFIVITHSFHNLTANWHGWI